MATFVISVNAEREHARTHAFRITAGAPFALPIIMRMLMTLWLTLGTVLFAQTDNGRGGRQGGGTGAGAPVVSEIVAVQVMLHRSGFSPGEIDGRAGTNLRQAIAAFQRANGLAESGQPDQMTWQRLSERNSGQPPLTSYVLTEADVAGSFVRDIPEDLMAQSKLQALGYRNPLEAIGEKF